MGLYIFFLQSTYEASSTLMVTRPAEVEQIHYQDVQLSRQLVDTYQVVAHSRRVLGKVITGLDLPYTWR